MLHPRLRALPALALLFAHPALGADTVRFLTRQDYPVGTGLSAIARVPPARGELPRIIGSTDLGLVMLGNQGGGVFGTATQIPSDAFVKIFAVGDLDGDGRLDLAYPDHSARTMQTLLATDHGFRTGPSAQTLEPPQSIYAADLDGDGRAEVIVGLPGKLAIYRLSDSGLGDPLHIPTGLGQTHRITAADINGDNLLDLFVIDKTSVNASLLLSEAVDGAAGTTYAKAALFDVGPRPVAAELADFDRDGHIDAIVVDERGLVFLPGEPNAWFGKRRDVYRNDSLVALGVADFNQDGFLDVATCDRESSALRLFGSDGKGAFQPQQSYGVGREPVDLAIGDIDGDGTPDAVVANRIGGSATVLRNLGGGALAGPLSLTTGDSPGALVSDDFNADGHLDLAVANERSDTIGLYLGNGHGGFRGAGSIRVGRHPRGLISGDFDGDEKVDLATVDFATDDVAILAGRGDGTFAAPLLLAVGLGPTAITAADFNGDGKQDLAVANTLSDSVSILFGDGTGRFPQNVNHAVPLHPTYLLAGDLNRDGRTDLVVGRERQETVSILFGNSTGLNPPTSGNMGATVQPLVAEDLDGDEVTDLVVLRDDHDDIGVLLGLPRGSFAVPIYFNVGRDPLAVAAGDFDENGMLDLAVVNRGSHDVLILLNATKKRK